ncbi:MAG: NAD(P)H-dependent oxidoreductase subunit E, partial [Armatimonadota bacterium]
MGEVDVELLSEVYEQHPRSQEALLGILRDAQELYGYLPGKVLEEIAGHLGLPWAKVYGVATFYPEFRLEAPGRHAVRVCRATACHVRGGRGVLDALRQELGIDDGGTTADGLFSLDTEACLGACAVGPAMTVGNAPHERVTADEVGGVLERCHTAGSHQESARPAFEVPLLQPQHRVVLRNCGEIDPRSIEEYTERGGYRALTRALQEMTPEEVIEAITASGLRGRGGAGFPTGKKWSFARAAEQEGKYLICNAHGGDPGAFGDRALLEGDPHSVSVGMAIAAYAIGAGEAIVYRGPEYPLAEEHLRLALEQARERGLLGDGIVGTDFSLDVSVEKAGAFVSGEETGLIMALEGKRAAPRPRPPFPARSGLWEKPTNINNVETLANVPVIIRDGPEAFAAVGTATSTGTKIVSLTGRVRNSGLVEAPMGTTLREIVCDIGGGVADGRELKGVQIGGPAGGCLPESALDLPLDYEAIQEAGAIMGSGGIVVLDGGTCTVDLVRLLAEFSQRESCGKCVPCRIGTRKMLDILGRIAEGTAPQMTRRSWSGWRRSCGRRRCASSGREP